MLSRTAISFMSALPSRFFIPQDATCGMILFRITGRVDRDRLQDSFRDREGPACRNR